MNSDTNDSLGATVITGMSLIWCPVKYWWASHAGKTAVQCSQASAPCTSTSTHALTDTQPTSRETAKKSNFDGDEGR